MRCVVLALVLSSSSCHLADDPEPPKCDPGFHVEYQRCVENKTADTMATIGKGCAITPPNVVVKARAELMFENRDDVAHVVTGLDGKLHEEIAPGDVSRFVSITLPGSYPYDVSGCPSGGTITVE